MIQESNPKYCIKDLLHFKNAPYLKDAPSELIDLLKERFKNCEAIDKCSSFDFWGFCDCRLILENKLAYKPEVPSPFIRDRREIEDRNVTRYIHSIRGLTDNQRDLLFDKANELKYQYGTEILPAIKLLYNSFKESDNDNEK